MTQVLLTNDNLKTQRNVFIIRHHNETFKEILQCSHHRGSRDNVFNIHNKPTTTSNIHNKPTTIKDKNGHNKLRKNSIEIRVDRIQIKHLHRDLRLHQIRQQCTTHRIHSRDVETAAETVILQQFAQPAITHVPIA